MAHLRSIQRLLIYILQVIGGEAGVDGSPSVLLTTHVRKLETGIVDILGRRSSFTSLFSPQFRILKTFKTSAMLS